MPPKVSLPYAQERRSFHASQPTDVERSFAYEVQRFSVHDGPGIRTTVFFKGCSLSCLWCHNPESQGPSSEISFNPGRCIACGRCAEACPQECHSVMNGLHTFDRQHCNECMDCVTVCPSGALRAVSRSMTLEDVLAIVVKDLAYYEHSGGGVTLSGGEPMLQPEAALSLLRRLKDSGLHTCLETSGCAPTRRMVEAISVTDLFLFDYKESDPVKHSQYTGRDNRLILKNLETLDRHGANLVLRCPVIPSFNDREDHFTGLATFANRLKNLREINIMPYHPYASYKWEQIGREYSLKDLKSPSDEQVEEWITRIAAQTHVPVCLG
jgi:glycyl-radical enzyme activating protein